MEAVVSSTVPSLDNRPRCNWCLVDPVMMAYHDDEWGAPVDDDDAYFERMVLELFQAGLSWRTILHKRPAFRRAFHDFSLARVASYGEADKARLMADTGIVRNRLKIDATIQNAYTFMELQRVHGSFHRYLSEQGNDPEVLRKELRQRFRFMGPKVADSFLESVGKIPAPHERGCWLASP